MILAQIIATTAVMFLWYAGLRELLKHSFTWGGAGGAFLMGGGAGYLLIRLWS